MDFLAVKIRRHIFLKNPSILALKPAFSKNNAAKEGGSSTPAPSFLRHYAIGKANKAFRFQIAFVSPSFPDGNGVPADLLK